MRKQAAELIKETSPFPDDHDEDDDVEEDSEAQDELQQAQRLVVHDRGPLPVRGTVSMITREHADDQ